MSEDDIREQYDRLRKIVELETGIHNVKVWMATQLDRIVALEASVAEIKTELRKQALKDA